MLFVAFVGLPESFSRTNLFDGHFWLSVSNSECNGVLRGSIFSGNIIELWWFILNIDF